MARVALCAWRRSMSQPARARPRSAFSASSPTGLAHGWLQATGMPTWPSLGTIGRTGQRDPLLAGRSGPCHLRPRRPRAK
eukprot:15478646-Alexandrium_andersonii.AAC.1